MPARILMCPPDFYGIEYQINPWMRPHAAEGGADRDLAERQWHALVAAVLSAGATVERLEPVKGLPDLVFTANAGLVYRNRFLSSRFRHPERAAESPVFDAWMAEHGYEVEHLPPAHYHEGAGDALFCGGTLWAGYRTRSDARSHQWVAQHLGVRCLPVELVNARFYHLDTCFCPLAPDAALYYPGAFDRYGLAALRSHIPNLIEVPEADAHRFGCNAVVLGRTVTHNAECHALARSLTAHGYESVPVELGEFLKAGGSAKCLTLRLDGEEAAGWREG